MSRPQRAELMMLLNDVGEVERSVFLGRLYVGVAHYLLEGAQVAALNYVVFAEGVADAVGPQLRPFDARFLHVPADYGVDEVSGDWAFVTVEHVVVRARSGNRKEKAPGLFADGNLAPAGFAADYHRFLLDVVLEEGAHLASTHAVVHYQG